jgi:hypothetical protein
MRTLLIVPASARRHTAMRSARHGGLPVAVARRDAIDDRRQPG